MNDDLSIQIINQTTETIQRLCDLSVRIDERVKTLQISDANLKESVDLLNEKISNIDKEFTLLKENFVKRSTVMDDKMHNTQKALVALNEKISEVSKRDGGVVQRVESIELLAEGRRNQWDKICDAIFRLLWLLLAAWLLAILGLQAPP